MTQIDQAQSPGGDTITDAQPPPPVDPLWAAIEPLLQRFVITWKFYWNIFWRPRNFAENHILAPNAASIKTAVKHGVWLSAYCAALFGALFKFSEFINKLSGQALSPDEFEKSFAGTVTSGFFLLAVIALQIIPVAVMLWLLSRSRQFSFAQSLLIFLHAFNLFLGAMLLFMTTMGLFVAPLEIIALLSGFISFPPKPENVVWLAVVFAPFMIAFAFFAFRFFWIVQVNLIAGTLNVSYWQGFWRLCISLLGLIPYLTILGIVESVWMHSAITQHVPLSLPINTFPPS